jgi:truncated hemoglobin YjbI
MSKFELQDEALKESGVSVEESQEAFHLQPSMLERIGGEDGFLELSTLFYERVFDEQDEVRFLNIFSSSTQQEAIDNQYRFLVQTFGGRRLYEEKKGKYTRLVGRHANYNIGSRAANQWMQHMKAALKEHSKLSKDEEGRLAMEKYFQYMAHYIVAAMQFMAPQLSGGTQMDQGRMW